MEIILADLNKAVTRAWENEFAASKNIAIHRGSIFELQCDAIVSPANSFGFMDGGLDLKISEFFGWQIQARLQELIKTEHHGELLVGAAQIVNTGHPKIPYLISAPTMRVPMVLGAETVNVYLATRAVMLLVGFGILIDGTPIKDIVKTVAIPGMGTGVGRVPPSVCARQMRQAIEQNYPGKNTQKGQIPLKKLLFVKIATFLI